MALDARARVGIPGWGSGRLNTSIEVFALKLIKYVVFFRVKEFQSKRFNLYFVKMEVLPEPSVSLD